MTADRVGELLGDTKHSHRRLINPEGVALDIRIATIGERITAFLLDLAFMFGAITIAWGACAVLAAPRTVTLVTALFLFASFIIRNAYFAHFELSAQGMTPGKRICGLRVINRAGGELTPSAVIARNLTREAEFFLPLTLLLSLDSSRGIGWQLALLGWTALAGSLPLWNRDHLRAGDIVAGTQVISMPRRHLSYDISLDAAGPERSTRYRFTDGQLSIYGALELQALEELLRRPATPEEKRQLAAACEKICAKIGWKEMIPSIAVRTFLTEFYAAERAFLERGQLFGVFRPDQKTRPGKRKKR